MTTTDTTVQPLYRLLYPTEVEAAEAAAAFGGTTGEEVTVGITYEVRMVESQSYDDEDRWVRTGRVDGYHLRFRSEAMGGCYRRAVEYAAGEVSGSWPFAVTPERRSVVLDRLTLSAFRSLLSGGAEPASIRQRVAAAMPSSPASHTCVGWVDRIVAAEVLEPEGVAALWEECRRERLSLWGGVEPPAGATHYKRGLIFPAPLWAAVWAYEERCQCGGSLIGGRFDRSADGDGCDCGEDVEGWVRFALDRLSGNGRTEAVALAALLRAEGDRIRSGMLYRIGGRWVEAK